MTRTILRLGCAAFATPAAAESRLKGAARAGGRHGPPGERGRPPRPRTSARPWAARVRAEVRARAERERGLRRGGLRPGRGCGRRQEARDAGEWGAGSGAAAERKRSPRTGASPGTGFRARRPLLGAGPGRARGAGAAGRPGADPERRGVCARRPPRARRLPPRVRRRPSARTSSIRPDRPPAPRPSITPAGAGGAQGTAQGRARGREPATSAREPNPGAARVRPGAGPARCARDRPARLRGCVFLSINKYLTLFHLLSSCLVRMCSYVFKAL